MDYDKNLKSLVRKSKKEIIEPNYYLMGLLCLLYQFNPSNKLSFFGTFLEKFKFTFRL